MDHSAERSAAGAEAEAAAGGAEGAGAATATSAAAEGRGEAGAGLEERAAAKWVVADVEVARSDEVESGEVAMLSLRTHLGAVLKVRSPPQRTAR